jgi:hypothetical protein
VALAAAMNGRAFHADPAAPALGDDVVDAGPDQPEAEYQGHDDDHLVGMGIDPAPQPGEELLRWLADSAYGDQDGFRAELAEAGLPFVMALKPRRDTWAYGPDAHTPVDAARALAWDGPDDPGDWTPVTRTFRDGHAETWWAADAKLGWWGPDGARRLVVATADPGTLPDKATWYLVTNLPRPGGLRQADSPHPAASLAEITRIYGIWHWIE